MNILNSLFQSEKTYTASIQTLSQSNTSGVIGPKVWTTTKSVPCLFWRGGISKGYMSDKYKADVVASVIMRPSDISAQEIPADSRIYIQCDTFRKFINNAAGYNKDDITIAIDGYNDSKNPIKRGDTFLIAGETGSPVHTVLSVTLTTGMTTGLTFSPALASNIADDTALTITPVMGYFYVIYPDNIAGQDEVIMVPVKEAA